MTKTTAPAATVLRPCGKCDGKGRINAFSHVAGGTCFACAGQGNYEAPADWREREARAAKRRAAAAAKRAASGENDVLWAEFTAEHPREAALIVGRTRGEQAHVLLSLAYSAVATFRREHSNPEDALHLVARFEGRA
jgi:hypothetical protein